MITDTEEFTLADTVIKARIIENRNSNITYFNMHEDEETSIKAGEQIVERYGGRFITLESQGNRTISFDLKGIKYEFDPNRIFTDSGVVETLKKHGAYSALADELVKDLSYDLLEKLSLNDSKILVALHNNKAEDYSILSYSWGGEHVKNTGILFMKTTRGKGNFFLTTDKEIFRYLKKGEFGVVLQSRKAKDDGSLSVYCANQLIPYVNVEAKHGCLSEQLEMLEMLQILK